MRIVSWNVNSLKARQHHVADYLDECAPDVLCMQELKMTDEAIPREIFSDRGYHFESHGQKQWNGVAIASKLPIEDVHRGLNIYDQGQSRLIAATVNGIRIVNLYIPQGQDTESPKFTYKMGFYEGLMAWLTTELDRDQEIIVLGDLNIARLPTDIWNVDEWKGKCSYTDVEHQAFDKLLSLGFEDVMRDRLSADTYTFWDYRQMSFRRKRGMRIDYILSTPKLAERVTEAWVDGDWRKREKPSDHAPVGAQFG
jgi:exodeoxyribonuclease-3